ncbi:MAG TPA: anthranilate synthase component I [Candidatus Tectomicrobia bacterium]|nr:anthranilate synthase component I [Candidatus Tectomicrobia bacterium]
MYYPSFDAFKAKASQGNLIPVYREVMADLETPVSAFLKLDRGDFSFLLESVEGGEKWGRYCFLGAEPSIVFQSKGSWVEITRHGDTEVQEGVDPLDALKQLMSDYHPVEVEGLPRFFGGAVGYLTYDMVRFFERLPDQTVDDLHVPDSMFMLTDTIVIFDHMLQKLKVVSNALIDGPPEKAYQQAIARIEQLIERLHQPVPPRPAGQLVPGPVPLTSNFTKEGYERVVERAKEYIRAGDIIQVVPSQRFEAPIDVDPFDIYRALRTVNPSPYMFYLKFRDLKLVGSSPEVMVRLEGPLIELRPIAGTRRRGRDAAEDREIASELMQDPKERAEHIMLVDLGRNDVGRVAKIGSVKVTELLVVEKYSHVMHLVSHVIGDLSDGKDCYDVMRATFPQGTVSGAPKIRAMQIIEELEPTKRGPYAGAVGYFSFSGNMDTCIALRTLTVKGKTAYLQAGGGVVADSVPELEYEETLNKARALVRAIELARAGIE